MVKIALLLQGARVGSLVRELISHMLRGAAKKFKKKERKKKEFMGSINKKLESKRN